MLLEQGVGNIRLNSLFEKIQKNCQSNGDSGKMASVFEEMKLKVTSGYRNLQENIFR